MVKTTGGRVLVLLHDIICCRERRRLAQVILGMWGAGNYPVAWPFTWSSWLGLGLMCLWMLLTGSLGLTSNGFPVSTKAWHPSEEAITVPFIIYLWRCWEKMGKIGTRVTLKSPLWLLPPWMSPEQPFSSCPDSVFLFSGHITFLTSFSFECTLYCTSGPGLVLAPFLEPPSSSLSS